MKGGHLPLILHTYLELHLHTFYSSIPLGASHLVVIEKKRKREERNRVKEELGLSGPPQLCTSTEPT
jgi:hypothetical protein